MKVFFRTGIVLSILLLTTLEMYSQNVCGDVITINADMNIAGETVVCEGETVFVENNTTFIENGTVLTDISDLNVFFVWEWREGEYDTTYSIIDLPTHVYTFNNQDPCDLDYIEEPFVLLEVFRICPDSTILDSHCNGSGVDIRVNPRPSFTPENGGVVCVGMSIGFTNNTCPEGEDDRYEWMWNFDDGNMSTNFEPEHTYLNPGTYNVTLTANHPECLEEVSTIRTVEVMEEPIAVIVPTLDGSTPINVTNPIVVCENEIMTFLNQSENTNGISYWDILGDASGYPVEHDTLGLDSLVHTFQEIGIFEVQLIMGNVVCPSDTTSVFIEVIEAIMLSIGENDTLCTGDEAILIEPEDTQQNGMFIISANGEVIDSSPSNSFTFSPSEYENHEIVGVCYTYTDTNGCNGSTCIDITIEGSANPNLPETPLPICNTNHNFDLGGLPEPPGTSGSWTNLDGTGGIINDSLFNPMIATGSSPYTLEYTFTSVAGCVSKDTLIVVIEDLPETDASMNSSPICIGENPVTLSGTPDCAPPLCMWSPAGSISPDGVITDTSAGIRTYTYTTNIGTPCEGSDTIQIEIINLSGIDPGADVQVCENESTHTLIPNTPGGTWSEADATPNSIDPNTGEVNINALTPGECYFYYYTLESQSIMCSNFDSLELCVQPEPILDINPSCAGDTLHLNATTDVTNYTIQWDFDANGVADADEATTYYIVGTDGSYEVTATLESDACTVTEMISGMLEPIPRPAFTLIQADTCSPSPVTFINNTVDPYSSLIWTISSGDTFDDFDIGTMEFPITADTVVTFYVTLTTCSSCGCDTALDSFQVFPSPEAFFVTDFPSYCSGEFVQMTTVDTLFADSCVWDFGGEIYMGCDPPYWQFFTDTFVNQIITLTTFSACGTSFHPDTIAISPTNVEAFIRTEPSDTVCLGTEICFTSFSTPLANLQWIVGDGLTPLGDTSFCHIFTTPGTFPVILRAAGCGFDEDTVIVHIDSLPALPIFTVQETGCTGDEIVFEIENYNELDTMTYEWDYGDGTQGNSLTHTYDSVGMYLVTLMVEDVNSRCISQWQQMIEIEDERPTAAFEASPISICLGESVGFTDMSSNSAATFSWSFGNGDNEDVASPTYMYPQAGTYTVILTVGNATNSCFDSDSIEIIVHPLPEVELMGTDIICAGENTGSIEAVTDDETLDYTFLWSTGANTPSINNLPAGNYSVTITDANLCETIADINLNEPLSILTITSESTPASCADLPMGQIDIEAGGGTPPYTFVWSNGSTNEDLDSLESGVYNITVTDGNGCTISTDVFVNSSDDISMDVQLTPISCAGAGDAVIEVEVMDGTVPFEYILIDEFGEEVARNTNPRFTQLPPGTYEVQVIDGNGCIDTDLVNIPEPDSLRLDIESNIDGDTLDLGETLILNVVHNAATLSEITWFPTDFLENSDSTTTLVNSPFVSQLYYEVEIIDAQGCVARNSITIHIGNRRNVFIPNAFSPDDNGYNDRFMIHADNGVNQVDDFQIFDRWGEKLFQQSDFQPNDIDFGWDGTFRGEEMPVGVYVYKIDISFVDGVTEQYMGDVTLIR